MFCSLFVNLCISALISHVIDETMVQEYHFDYHNLGPQVWKHYFSDCGLNRQSPIALDSNTSQSVNTPTIKWFNWKNKPTIMKIQNSGHTVMVLPKWDYVDAVPYVTFSTWPNPYIFHQFHFHWGATPTEGSEHTIDGQRYPLELHAAFYRKDLKAYATARKSPESDALVAITLLYEIGKPNDALERLVASRLNSIKYWGSSASVPPESLDNLVPEFTNNYYMYNGSLTTPPCTENVVFLVAKATLTVADTQLNNFRTLIDHTQRKLAFNFRPLQELNGRPVYLIT